MLIGTMNTNELVAALDAEIARLTHIRSLLGEGSGGSSTGASGPAPSAKSSEAKRRGRPKGSTNKATSFNPEEFAPKRRTMTAAGKERIAAAQRARWAKQKMTDSAKKSPAAKVVAKKTLGTKQAAKKSSAPAKKVAAKPLPKSAAQTKAAPAKKGARKAQPAKKAVVKAAARPAAKKLVPQKSIKAKATARPVEASQTSLAEGSTTAAAE